MITEVSEESRISSAPNETRLRRNAGPIAMCAILVLGALIFFPAIRAPLFLDDYLQGAMVEGTFAAPRGPFDLYDFVDDGNRNVLLERGLLPWWSDPRLTIRFFRPLSSALLYVDHKLTGHGALPMHLHSFAWWVAAAFAVRALFRRFFDARPSLLATAIFALAPCHALPLAWVANREAILSLTFGALALGAHASFRDERRSRDALVAASFYALALLGGGEYALSFGGYVVAMEVAHRKDTLAKRITGWLPFVVPALLYLAVRGALKYGTAGSGFYSDPIHDPGAFFAKAPIRAIGLLGTGWLTVDSEGWRSGAVRWVLVVAVGVAILALVKPVRDALARLDDKPRGHAMWLLVGSMISLVPVLAVVPSRRLLGTAMIGIAATVALVLERTWFPTEDEEARDKGKVSAAIASLVATGLAFAHLVHGPGTAFLASRQHRADGLDFASRVAFERDQLGDPTKAEVGVIRGLAGDFFAPFALDPRGVTPARWCVLGQAGHILALRRDARTLELVAPRERGLYPIGERNLYRPADAPLRAGASFHVPGVDVVVVEASPQYGPRIVRFTFDKDPDAMTWFADDFGEVRAVTLPKVGFGAPFDPQGDRTE